MKNTITGPSPLSSSLPGISPQQTSSRGDNALTSTSLTSTTPAAEVHLLAVKKGTHHNSDLTSQNASLLAQNIFTEISGAQEDAVSAQVERLDPSKVLNLLDDSE